MTAPENLVAAWKSARRVSTRFQTFWWKKAKRGNISDGGGQVKSGNPGISRIIIHK